MAKDDKDEKAIKDALKAEAIRKAPVVKDGLKKIQSKIKDKQKKEGK